MIRRLTPPEPWWADAADLIARREISLRQAAAVRSFESFGLEPISV